MKHMYYIPENSCSYQFQRDTKFPYIFPSAPSFPRNYYILQIFITLEKNNTKHHTSTPNVYACTLYKFSFDFFTPLITK